MSDEKRSRTPMAGTRGPDDDGTQPHPMAQADALGATVISYLVTGPALFGAIGWGIDRAVGGRAFFFVGMLTGMGLSLYTIWLRYGRPRA